MQNNTTSSRQMHLRVIFKVSVASICYAILEALNDITLIRTFQATNQSAGETGITIWCISQSGEGLDELDIELDMKQ